jgi:cytochrome c oxidase subunit I+III
MFAGFNTAFLPMHWTGLYGMPRRVHTYAAETGWGDLNMISTLGAFVFALGVALVLVDLAFNLRPSLTGGSGNPWRASTLEWLPNDYYVPLSVPRVTSRDPLWDQPGLQDDTQRGRGYMPGSVTRQRETLITSPVEGEPQSVLRLPGPGLAPILAAVGTAGFFLLLTVAQVTLAVVSGLAAVAATIVWLWPSDPGPEPGPVDIGHGQVVPVYETGTSSHSFWAMVVLLLVAASLYLSYVFSYLYTWTAAPQVWPAPHLLPPLRHGALSGALLVLGSGTLLWAGRLLAQERGRGFALALVMATVCLAASLAVDLAARLDAGQRPDREAHDALTYMGIVLQGQLVAALVLMTAYCLARRMAGKLHAGRRNTFDNTSVLFHYACAQGLLGLALTHGFPRLVG